MESNHPHEIGEVGWSREDITESIEDFYSLYKSCPNSQNEGGMGAPHQFLFWFLLRHLEPDHIIESGVWKGYGSWFIEKACPDAQIHCIDPNLERVEYRPDNSTYYNSDFSEIDWGNLPEDETLLFFDDHQNAPPRLRQARRWGFRYIVFEDNYPPGQGDCYSLKNALEGGFPETRDLKTTLGHVLTASSIRNLFQKFRKLFEQRTKFSADFVRNELSVYKELPPVFAPDTTRWGEPWDRYASPEPLLREPTRDCHLPFQRDIRRYTWMCYAEIDYSTDTSS
ncbi:hypothetical protein [Salinibacter ruber]|uniref:Class I SAM-dependent methyltransferase n=1 Tax=Salinibacter ruber TaxID=146919 RepID=A0AAW5PAU7_9BACT|nr:hypothetical protein [Salinibacter ruber]MCS4158442.1 hypothetical protein [Salinibacter ruber]